MISQQLPSASQIRSLSDKEQAAILDLLFEPCVPLHELSVPLLHETPFKTYDDLIDRVGDQLNSLAESSATSDRTVLEMILSAHPRLGETKVKSEQSSGEQAQLHGNRAEGERLAGLNADYERTFPGLRYVVFVNGRDRETIMADMTARINRHDIELERREAIQAMCQIAAARARTIGVRE